MAPAKRKGRHDGPELELVAALASQMADQAELDELRAFKCALMRPTQTAGAIFDMQTPGDKLLLAQAIWQGVYSDRWWCLREANPRVTTLLPRAR